MRAARTSIIRGMKTTNAVPERADMARRENAPWPLVPRQARPPEDTSGEDPDLPTDVSWALRVASGVALASWGLVTLGPVVTAFAHSPIGHALTAAWFTSAIGMALVAAGAMLMTKTFVPLAITLLVPVSVHLLFQCVVLNG